MLRQLATMIACALVVGTLFIPSKGVAAQEWPKLPLVEGVQFMIKNGKACRTLENAIATLSNIEKFPFFVWNRHYEKGVSRGYCMSRSITFVVIEFVRDDAGKYREWIDFDGDVWRIVKVRPTNFTARNKEGVVWLMTSVPEGSEEELQRILDERVA